MLKNLFFWIALCWTGVVVFFCLTPSNDFPTVEIPYLDKLVHAFFYFVFTILWFLFFKKQVKKSNEFKLLISSGLFSILFGIGIETIQAKFTTTRSGDFLDVVANTSGVILAFVAVLLTKKVKS